MSKYVAIKVHGIVTQIAKPTEIKGYTEGIIEVFLPDETKMTDLESRVWVKDNNKRMTAICKFLNDGNL